MAMPIHHIAATQMFFLVEGMNDATRREGQVSIDAPVTKPGMRPPLYQRIADEKQMGVIDFVGDMSPIIDTLTACILAALEMQVDFPGVFEYEVTSSVGDWLFMENYYRPEKLNDNYDDVCSLVKTKAYSFFKQCGNKVPYSDYMALVARYEEELRDGKYR